MEAPEAKLASVVVGWLNRQGWAVYQEVPLVLDGQLVSVDLVAEDDEDGLLHAYEVKLRLTPHLVGQALRLRPYADRVSAVCEEPRGQSGQHQRRRAWLANQGVGLLYVPPDGGPPAWAVRPKEMLRCPAEHGDRLRDALCDEQRTGPAAGSSSARRWAADDWSEARALLRERPGLTGRELRLELAWSKQTARRFLTDSIAGRIRGVRADTCVSPVRYFFDRKEL